MARRGVPACFYILSTVDRSGKSLKIQKRKCGCFCISQNEFFCWHQNVSAKQILERVGGELDFQPEEGGAVEVGNPLRNFQLAGNQNQTRIPIKHIPAGWKTNQRQMWGLTGWKPYQHQSYFINFCYVPLHVIFYFGLKYAGSIDSLNFEKSVNSSRYILSHTRW